VRGLYQMGDIHGINQKGSRYFIAFEFIRNKILYDFVCGPLMKEITSIAVGDEVYLFIEQFVVKGAQKGLEFKWHQDSAYIPYSHPPYMTCWIALDDMTLENGTVHVLPYSQVGTSALVPHQKNTVTGDLVGYSGPNPGIPALFPAGSMAVFSSTLLHCSGYNNTDKMRRAYVVQYSPKPIITPDGKLRHFAEPVQS